MKSCWKNYAYAVASDTVDSQFEKLETQWLSSIEVEPGEGYGRHCVGRL